jgi:hypothetical protein
MAPSCPPPTTPQSTVTALTATSLQVEPVNFLPGFSNSQAFSPYSHSYVEMIAPVVNAFPQWMSPGTATPRVLGTGEGADFRPRLRAGAGSAIRFGGCLMQVASFLADGVSWTDHPLGADEYLAGYARSLNDYANDEGRQELLPLAPRLAVSQVGSLSRRADAWTQIAADEIELFARGYPGEVHERAQALAKGTWEYLHGGPMPSVVELDLPAPMGLALSLFGQVLSFRRSGSPEVVVQSAQQVLWNLIHAHNVWAGPRGREALGTALDAHERVTGRRLRTLEEVPGEVWERMHRGMMGLAA